MASWTLDEYLARCRRVLDMNRPVDAGYSNRGVSPAEPTAGADGSVRDGSPNFASQIDAARALRDRLYGDRVAHTTKDDR